MYNTETCHLAISEEVFSMGVLFLLSRPSLPLLRLSFDLNALHASQRGGWKRSREGGGGGGGSGGGGEGGEEAGPCFEAINSLSLPLMTLFLRLPPPSRSCILHNAGEDQA